MTTSSKQNDIAPASVGIDIGKDVFHLVGFDPDGRIVLRRKIRRSALVNEFEKTAALHRRHGSLPERTFCQPDASQTGL